MKTLARLLNPSTIVFLEGYGKNGLFMPNFTIRVLCVHLEMIVTSNQDLFIYHMPVESDYMALDAATKPVFGVSDKVRIKPVLLSYRDKKIEISLVASVLDLLISE